MKKILFLFAMSAMFFACANDYDEPGSPETMPETRAPVVQVVLSDFGFDIRSISWSVTPSGRVITRTYGQENFLAEFLDYGTYTISANVTYRIYSGGFISTGTASGSTQYTAKPGIGLP